MQKMHKRMNWFYVPALMLLVLFVAYPLGNAFFVSLTKWNGYSSHKTFIGINNYIRMTKDPAFWTSFRNTILYGFGSTILQQILGLALAIFVNSEFKGRNLVRTIVYLPAMMSGLVMGYVLYFFFQYDQGVVNEVLSWFGYAPVDWMGEGIRAVLIITFVNVWQFTGLSMIIYLAGLQGVSQTYYEAAQIDGANKWRLFIHITLPSIYPSIVSSTMFNLIGGLKLFDAIQAMTGGGPGNASHSLSSYLTREYFGAEKAGYAGAIGVFIFAFIMLVSYVLNSAFRKGGERLS
ncbi:MAG: sugar ABC transporter permease [Lachnospiraceae bacterium]|nr:sugar ABC transporter permease [Lachnospiraceae bacterium]